MRMGEVIMQVKRLKWTVCLGVALAPWLLAVPAPAADEVFSVTKIISLPDKSPGSAIPSFFEIKESGGVHTLSEKNLIVIF